MKTLPRTEARAQLNRLVDRVAETDEEIVITRKGRPAAILISAAAYEAWKETRTVQSDQALMVEIRRGLRELRKGGGRIYTLEELIPCRRTA